MAVVEAETSSGSQGERKGINISKVERNSNLESEIC